MTLSMTVALLASVATSVEIVHHLRTTKPSRAQTPRLVVPDADAHKGSAQAAIPGKSVPDSEILSFYSHARPPGRYQITWRVKASQNTEADSVMSMHTSFNRLFRGGVQTIKGTDFAKPNVYQDFSYTAEKDEGGFFTMRGTWHGGPAIHVDSITVKLLERFDERRLLRQRGAKINLPDIWTYPETSPLRIHLGKGLWWDFFGIREAIAELGGAITTSSYHSNGQGGTALKRFPADWQRLVEHNVVMLANIDAMSLGAQGRLSLIEFVRNGGGLFLFGGYYGLDSGGIGATGLADILPCTLSGEGRKRTDTPLVLWPGDGELLPGNLSWSLRPHVYYHHQATAKADAQVLVQAGEHPMLIIGKAGKGRVAVFAASAEGRARDGQLAFWDWGDMPRVVASVTKWLADAPKEKHQHAMSDADRALLSQLALPAEDDEDGERRRQLTSLLSRCRSKAFAKELLAAVHAFGNSPAHAFVEATSLVVHPYVDPSFESEIEDLIASADPGKASLAIRLLGAIEDPQARSKAENYLREGAEALPKGGGLSLDEDDGGGQPAMHVGGDAQVQLAAVMALADIGDPKSLPALRKISQEFSNKRQELSQISLQAELNENIYQQSLLARCLLGDGDAVGPFLDAVIHNVQAITQLQNSLDVMLVNPKNKKLMHTRKLAYLRLPKLHQRQVALMNVLSGVSYNVATDVIGELVVRDEPALVPFAYVALAPSDERVVTPDVVRRLLPLLKQCPFPGLRRLPVCLADQLKDTQAGADIAQTLRTMAASEELADAVAAIRLASRLDAKDCAAILAAARESAHPTVRRLAKLYQPLAQN